MAKCCFCRDDLENYHSNLQYPGGVERWLCGACCAWIEMTVRLQHMAEAMRQVNASLAECERHAEELATGIGPSGAITADQLADEFERRMRLVIDGNREHSDPHIIVAYEYSIGTIRDILLPPAPQEDE